MRKGDFLGPYGILFVVLIVILGLFLIVTNILGGIGGSAIKLF